MKLKFTIYVILLISSVLSLFYLIGISFLMYFGKRRNIETEIDNQLIINYFGLLFLEIIVLVCVFNIWKLNKD